MNVIDEIIAKQTMFETSQFTGGNIQITISQYSQEIRHKLVLYFGYTKTRNPMKREFPISEQDVVLFATALIDKAKSVADALNEGNRILSYEELTKVVRGNSKVEVVGRGREVATSYDVTKDKNVATFDDEYEYFKSLRQSHSDELKKYKTNAGTPRRSSSTVDDNFKKYKKLRNVYSQTVLGIIIRADCTGSTPHDITGLLNTKFPTAMANLLKKQDNDLLDESLSMSDKEFITFMQHIGDM